MAKKDGGNKKKKDAEVVAPVNGHEHEAATPLHGHPFGERTGLPPADSAPEPPPLPPVEVEPQALPPVAVKPVDPIEPPLVEVTPGPRPTPTSAPSPLVPRAPAAPVTGWSGADLADAARVPLQVVRSVLPTSRTPVVLGVVALGLVGVLDWPAALGVGLGWEALRRWGPDPTRP